MHGIYAVDEYNPHLVWQLNDQESIQIIDHNDWAAERWANLTGTPKPDTVGSQATRFLPEFYDKYARSKAATDFFEFGENGFVPLAYRLDILTTDVQKDIFNKDKLGGIPDLRRMLYGHCNSANFHYHWDLEHHKENVARKYPNGEPPIKTLRQGLNAIWPRCGCCRDYMRFIGQMDYSAWRHVIHVATRRSMSGFYGEVSAFGSTQDRPFVDSERQLFFYCPCNAFNNPNNDCVILREQDSAMDLHNACDILEGKREEPVPLCTDAQYKRAVCAFMKRVGVHPSYMDEEMASATSVRFITGFDLNFELDWPRSPGNYDLHDCNEKIREAVPPQAGNYGSDFQLFGKAKSQQDPRRPMSFGGEQPLRMSPILSWTDDDFTYQMYGDFRIGNRRKPLMCKYDGSCT